MNNHRSSNRRRGRGNRQQGGGNQSNRIDSRARGNAPQMLDKYKKLAQDAQHNGDRVQAEYYLQFADHYFRVIADGKSRQDDQRVKRYEERDQDQDDDDRDQGDDDGESRRRQPRNVRGRREEGNGRADGGDRDDRVDNEARDSVEAEYEPPENPFKPASKPSAKPRAEGRKPRKPRGETSAKESPTKDGGEIDVSALPPSIGDAGEGDAPKKKRATRARKTAEPTEDDEAVRAVG